jgi:copper chaperone CopZ
MCRRSVGDLRTMNSPWQLLPAVLLLAAGTTLAAAPAKKADPNEPLPQTRTFFIDGVKSEADVKTITDAVTKVKSVTKVDQLTAASGCANITFDHHAVTHQQIAQAIADAGPFRASLRFVIPDYAAHAQQVDAIFAKVKDEVQIETTNKEKGEFTLRFLPLKAGKPGPHGVGFNLGKIGHPIGDPAPQGLGLKLLSTASNPAKRPVVKKAAAKK